MIKYFTADLFNHHENDESNREFLQRLELLQKQIEAQTIVTSASTNGKTQNRVAGQRSVKNSFLHSTVIGVSIDFFILNAMSGRFSKQEIADAAGTKISKINSHLNNELSKKYGLIYSVNASGKLVFHFPEDSRGLIVQSQYLRLTSKPRKTAEERQTIIKKTRIR